jgi:hypothetical protein
MHALISDGVGHFICRTKVKPTGFELGFEQVICFKFYQHQPKKNPLQTTWWGFCAALYFKVMDSLY